MTQKIKNRTASLSLALAISTLMLLPSLAFASDVEILKHIPIQHNGRVKPFDSFARQTLRLFVSSEKWQKKQASTVLWEALVSRDEIKNWQWIRIDYNELEEYLGLNPKKHFFSYEEIKPSLSKVEFLTQNARTKRQRDERPSKLEQKAENLYNQTRTFELLESAQLITVVPPKKGHDWFSPFYDKTKESALFDAILKNYKAKNQVELRKSADEWLKFVHQEWPHASTIHLEVLYFKISPFNQAAIFYLIAFFLWILLKKNPIASKLAFFSFVAAMGFHTFGLICRVLVLGRPPVSNMFESMIFMNWALAFFALIFALIRRNATALIAGSLASALVMIYSALLPIDSSLDVLVPVLRSNYWLTIHVMTVVASYGAFGLAMGLGHRHLILAYLKKLTKKAEQESAELMDRVIQLGVILIGSGTVLGGVWANESWGRFWGWDPKETWAFITFLSYLIVIHLRFFRKMDNFYLALSSILGFFVVLMTWYGVNFVLGRGLHSYGQGSGGMRWVVYYLVAEIIFIIFILSQKSKIRSKS